MTIHTRIALAFAALAASAGLAMTAAPAAPAADFKGDPYPLATCPVSGEKLGADAVVEVVDGRQLKFCCAKCVASFKKDAAKYTTKMDEAIAKDAGAYPLKHCLVMKDEELEDDAVTYVWNNRVFKFCCKKCIAKFNTAPEGYVKAYEAEVVTAQKPGYKATTCPISGKPLGDGAQDVVVNGRLVRTCCGGCVGAVKADPKAAFAKIDGGAPAKKDDAEPADKPATAK
jgi:YHS domain-containing protein